MNENPQDTSIRGLHSHWMIEPFAKTLQYLLDKTLIPKQFLHFIHICSPTLNVPD
jgi:hypothetical protein